jgi:hypothetical protein
MESLKGWLEETLGKLSKKSDTARAVRYALGPREALLRFCDDGRIEIDNNAAERSNNSLGSPAGSGRIHPCSGGTSLTEPECPFGASRASTLM